MAGLRGTGQGREGREKREGQVRTLAEEVISYKLRSVMAGPAGASLYILSFRSEWDLTCHVRSDGSRCLILAEGKMKNGNKVIARY